MAEGNVVNGVNSSDIRGSDGTVTVHLSNVATESKKPSESSKFQSGKIGKDPAEVTRTHQEVSFKQYINKRLKIFTNEEKRIFYAKQKVSHSASESESEGTSDTKDIACLKRKEKEAQIEDSYWSDTQSECDSDTISASEDDSSTGWSSTDESDSNGIEEHS
jgi:hypothetical protein